MRRIIVGITGASGSIYGVRLLEVLAAREDIETHLIVTAGAATTIGHELGRTVSDIAVFADVVHRDDHLAASVASGSFRVDAMVVAPCSIKTLSAIAHSHADTLLVRAADVRLKERQRLLLVVRETPLHLGHLRLMTAATEAGAIVFPPTPAMYTRPVTVEAIVDHTVMRVCDQLGIETELSLRWPSGQ